MSILSMLGLGSPKFSIPNDPVVAQIRASEYRELIEMIANVKEAAKAIEDLKVENARLKEENKDLKRQMEDYESEVCSEWI